MAAPIIRIQTEDFSLDAEIGALTKGAPSQGAVASFLGLVRDHTRTCDLLALELEHYPGMTERALEEIAREAQERFGLGRVLIIHRVGRLAPAERIVLAAAAAAHREAAFDGARFLMDYLKTDAPFWKKEVTRDADRWVEARESDVHARARWSPGRRLKS